MHQEMYVLDSYKCERTDMGCLKRKIVTGIHNLIITLGHIRDFLSSSIANPNKE